MYTVTSVPVHLYSVNCVQRFLYTRVMYKGNPAWDVGLWNAIKIGGWLKWDMWRFHLWEEKRFEAGSRSGKYRVDIYNLCNWPWQEVDVSIHLHKNSGEFAKWKYQVWRHRYTRTYSHGNSPLATRSWHFWHWAPARQQNHQSLVFVKNKN